MKRLLAFTVAIIILLCGCSANSQDGNTERYKNGFKSDFTMLYRGYELMGNLSMDKSRILTIELVKPDDLQGLTVRCNGDESIISLDGIVVNANDNEDIQTSFADILYRIFTMIAYKSDALSFNKDKIIGDIADGEFVATVDSSVGLQSAELKSSDFKIDFKNFTFTD